MGNIKAAVRGTFSLGGMQRRMFRVAVVTFAYWGGLSGFSPDTQWAEFLRLISSPYAVVFWLVCIAGAGSSSGLERAK